MEMIKANTKNEITKLLSLKKYKILLILLSIFIISGNILRMIEQNSIMISFINSQYIILAILTQFILPLIIAMVAADLFTSEQENGSIKAIITRPVGRFNIFISKVITIILYTISILLVCLIISTISNIMHNGIVTVNIIEALTSYIVSVFPMIPMILFAVVISQLCRNSSSTVMVFVLGYAVICTLSSIIPSINPLVFTSYTSWYKLFLGTSMPLGKVLNILALLIAYALLFFQQVYGFSKKRNIKIYNILKQ